MIHHFNDLESATEFATTSNKEVYGLNGGYVVLSAEEADELVTAGANLTVASPEDEHFDESMDGDHESALESVYGSSENYDIDHDDGGFFED